MRRRLVLIIVLSILTILMTGCCFEHEWEKATCTEPKTCSKCQKTEGNAIGHSWIKASCTSPKTCSECGKTKGEALGHKWEKATCTEPQVCFVCGEIEGEALGHKWEKATCTNPVFCGICGETRGDVLEHKWIAATCISPETCEMCGKTTGTSSDRHRCNREGMCEVCHKQIGERLTMDNYKDYLNVYVDGSFLKTAPLVEGEYHYVEISFHTRWHTSALVGSHSARTSFLIGVDGIGEASWSVYEDGSVASGGRGAGRLILDSLEIVNVKGYVVEQ